MAVPSSVGDVKIVSPISTFVLNTLTLKKRVFFFFTSGPNLLKITYNRVDSIKSTHILARYCCLVGLHLSMSISMTEVLVDRKQDNRQC